MKRDGLEVRLMIGATSITSAIVIFLLIFHNLRGYDSHLIIREAYNTAQKLKSEEQELEQVGDKTSATRI